jgi:DNA topoisomerase-1
MEAYCMKCKTKREMKDAVASFNAKASPVTIGVCSVCGTKLYRMGRTEAHEGMTPPPKPEKVAKVVKREGKLVIVESPAKAKTVGRFLGKGYTVRASVGHVRDLLKSQLSVDVENNFTPKYRVPNEKKEVVKELKKLAQKAEEIYLATDPDREGKRFLGICGDRRRSNPATNAMFPWVRTAIKKRQSPRRQYGLVDTNRRRILDRLVGHHPILWEKDGPVGWSSICETRLIVERT